MKRFAYRVSLFAFMLLLTRLPARAANNVAEFSVRVPQLTAPPSISGTIDNSWQGAARLDLA